MATTQGSNPGPDRKPQAARKHPDEFERDLNPDGMAGQNIGPLGEGRPAPRRNAHDFRAFTGPSATPFVTTS
jgi:hypothetical protein